MGFLSGLFHSRDKPTNSTNGSAYRFLFGGNLEGLSMDKIAAGLERDGILTGAGKSKWHTSTINKILRNEKYIGDDRHKTLGYDISFVFIPFSSLIQETWSLKKEIFSILSTIVSDTSLHERSSTK